MELLINEWGDQRPRVVVLFGLGMIGSAVRDALERLQFRPAVRQPVDWNATAGLAEAGEAIHRHCLDVDPTPSRISVAWSAGAANFFSTGSEVENENRSFDQIVRLVCELRDGLPETGVGFHYFSSAGGLFEGQRVISATSQPTPQRPYGRMKRRQEILVRSSLAAGSFTIYRPSSVYGPMIRPRRHGLINQLIANASNRRMSVLDANVMALRDYVYSGDIGTFVARRIAFSDPAKLAPEQFLVSARCASIFEVAAQIERVMKLKVRFRFDEQFGNSANITFSDRVLPPGWRPSTLDVGIRQFMLRDRPQTRAISATIS